MPVLPLVGSTSTVLPGWIFPACSASLIMLTPMRSFTLLHGFMLSSLATTVARAPSVTLFSLTRGVWPITSVTSFAIFIEISSSDADSYRCYRRVPRFRYPHRPGLYELPKLERAHDCLCKLPTGSSHSSHCD